MKKFKIHVQGNRKPFQRRKSRARERAAGS